MRSIFTSASAKALHNGKGRPLLPCMIGRQFSQTSYSKLNALRPVPPRLAPISCSRPVLATNVRYASTTPASTSFAHDASIPEPSTAWDVPLDVVHELPLRIESHVGWLKELGIDFGWGTSTIVQWFVENVHLYSGLPWVGAVALTTIACRAILLPYYISASDMSARIATLKPMLKPITDRMTAARASKDSTQLFAAYQEQRAVYQRAQINMFQIFKPMLFQIPIGFGIFRLTNNMARLPVPGLENEGMLWIPDMTMSDPAYILPLAISGLLYATLKRGGEMGSIPDESRQFMTIMRYVLPFISLACTSWLGAITQVYFAVTAIWSYAQARAFQSPSVRQTLGMQPLPLKGLQASQAAGPYKGTLNVYKPLELGEESKPKGPWGKLKQQARSYMSTKDKHGPRLSKQEKQRADEYEKKRRDEIDAEEYRRQREHRR